MKYNVRTENKLILEYQQCMVDHLSNALSDILDQADDIFFKFSISNYHNKDHSDYFLAMREIRLNREVVEKEFRNKLNDNLLNRYSGSDADNAFCLSDDIDIEERIAINYSIRRANSKCAYSLLCLDKKIKNIMESEKKLFGENSIVLKPDDICALFAKVSSKLSASTAVRLILYKLFEITIAFNLDKIYTNIGNQLDLLNHEDALNDTRENKGNKKTKPLKMDKVKGITATENDNVKDQDRKFYLKATSIIRNEIESHIHESNIPEFIRLFLLEHWSKLLMKIYIRDGQGSNAWMHAMDVIDDMIYLIENPDQLKDSDYQFNLNQRLIFGMNIIPLSTVKRDDFMDDLAKYFQKNIMEEELIKEKHNPAKIEISPEPNPEDISEDETVPNPQIQAWVRGGNIPFMSELLVDLK